MRAPHPWRGRVLATGVLAVAGVLATGCAGGAIAQNTPTSNGQSFVSGSPGTTVFKTGSGPMAPKLSGPKLGGGRLSLAANRGHVVVLNFWGSWCSPCRAEAPAMAALAAHFASSGVRFLGIDIRDSPATAQAYMSDFRITYPSFNDPSDNLALAFRNTVPPAGIPTTLVISRSGRITARVIGGVTYTGLKSLIGRAVSQPS
ncbi:MAG TPA: TlpA disulfide reductase family protein [Streptosporangiaceae bacterium]|nr:TlpA disulfide reductase family protein [Streptosporangiaceae bacterium]